MEIQSMVDFLVGSILFAFGTVIIASMVVVVNNIFHKYWKPVKWTMLSPVEYRFVDPNTLEQYFVQEKKEKDKKEVKA
jgi:hypothetical protein